MSRFVCNALIVFVFFSIINAHAVERYKINVKSNHNRYTNTSTYDISIRRDGLRPINFPEPDESTLRDVPSITSLILQTTWDSYTPRQSYRSKSPSRSIPHETWQPVSYKTWEEKIKGLPRRISRPSGFSNMIRNIGPVRGLLGIGGITCIVVALFNSN